MHVCSVSSDRRIVIVDIGHISSHELINSRPARNRTVLIDARQHSVDHVAGQPNRIAIGQLLPPGQPPSVPGQ